MKFLILLLSFALSSLSAFQAADTHTIRKEATELQALYAQWEKLQDIEVDENKRKRVASQILNYWEAELHRCFQQGLRDYPNGAKSYQASQEEWLKFRDSLLLIASHYHVGRDYTDSKGNKVRIRCSWEPSDRYALQALLTMQRVIDLKEIASHRSYSYLGTADYTALSQRDSGAKGELERFCDDLIEGTHSASFRDALSMAEDVWRAQCDAVITLLYGWAYTSDDEENIQKAYETLKRSPRETVRLNVDAIDEGGDFRGVGSMYLDVRMGYYLACTKTQYNILMTILLYEPLDFRVFSGDAGD